MQTEGLAEVGRTHTHTHTHTPPSSATLKGTGPSEVQGLQEALWARNRRAGDQSRKTQPAALGVVTSTHVPVCPSPRVRVL